MSLDWNAERVANFTEGTDEWKESVAYFCYALMAIGVSRVTKENLGDIHTRIKIWNALYGPVRYRYDEETHVKTSVYDYDFLLSVIGYGTNVSNETFGQWIKRIGNRQIKESQDNFAKSIAKAEGLEPVAV